MDSFYIWHKFSLEGVSRVTFFFQNLEIWIFGKFKKIFGFELEIKIYSSRWILSLFSTNDHHPGSMRGCVAYDDIWPWPISSRSFGLGLENRVRSVASTVLDGFFPYLVQMITSMRRCVACDDLWTWPPIFKVIRPWLWKSCPLCNIFSSRSIISIFATNNHYNQRVCRVLFWLGIWYESLVWVIMGRRGYSENAGVLVVLVITGCLISQVQHQY